MTTATIINNLIDRVKRELRVCMPCVVVKYYATEGVVDVHVNIKEVFKDLEQEVPQLIKIPVIFSRTKEVAITYPINAGDCGIVLFCDRDIKNWLLSGQNVKPASKRMHHFTDSVFIAGLFPSKSGKAINAKDLVVEFKDTKITIEDSGNVIIKASSNIILDAKKDVNILAEENINLTAQKDINLTANGDAKLVVAKNATVDITGNSDLKIGGNAQLQITGNAELNIAGNITSSSVNWEHIGDLKLVGAMQVTKTLDVLDAVNLGSTLDVLDAVNMSSTLTVSDSVTTKNGITNSGGNLVSNGITFESHKHTYEKAALTTCGAGAGSVTTHTPLPTGTPT